VVQACAKDSFTSYYWRYPVVGKLPYKGFFNPEDAKKEAERLTGKNLDVIVRHVDAFSTLGFFKDPLYSFMKDYSPARLADLVIHESTHATVFLRGEARFNEELAEFIGTEGAKLYIESRFGKDSKEYREMTEREEDNAAFVEYIQSLITKLDSFYKSAASGGLPAEEILAGKEKIILEFQKEFESAYDSVFKSGAYKSFSSLHINNAYLSLYMLYYGHGDSLKEIYIQCGSNLKAFIELAKKLTPKRPPEEQLKAMSAGLVFAGSPEQSGGLLF